MLADGCGEVGLLDVFEAELHNAMPSDCHPEDWATAAGVPWRLIETPCTAKQWAQVIGAQVSGAHLLGGYRDRVAAEELRRKPMKQSLALFEPDELWWWIRLDGRGKRRNRALFRRNHVTYDLAVTDPVWLDQLNLLPEGIYPHSTLAPAAQHTWLTVSLSEGFEAQTGAGMWHYRLVAAVIVRES